MGDEIEYLRLNLNIKKLNPTIPKKILYIDGQEVLKDKNSFSMKNNFEEIFFDKIKFNCFKNRLTNFKDIRNDDVVFSKWYNGDIIKMKIKDINKEKNTAIGLTDDGYFGVLYFNCDFRNCWLCRGYMSSFDLCKYM